MAQGSVKETISRLVVLQAVDVELYEFKRLLKEKPAQALQLKALYDAKKYRLDALEVRAREADLNRKSRELDLKVKEQSILSANSQLMTLKTNKEYQAKLFEIENLKSEKSVLEDEILKIMDASEKLQAGIVQEKNLLAEEEKKYLAEKNRVDAELAEVKSRIAAVETRRAEAASGTDAATLGLYDRVLEHKDGVALVPLAGNTCGGCFMNLPSQVSNEIRMYTHLVRCEMCARILYIPEDLE